ncbi:MAG: metalloregulator ArsR/SmtB family transcription factor [Candidatus Hydrogenedentota bacterium]|nr:MAG: metalloregulator ArsR/SmtB family transcription factor [Candidatus Hydrogenedentota bacterium]
MSNAEKEAGLTEAARLFGVLAEPARLRILLLLRNGSMCGRELARDLNLTPATTCYHLGKLKLAKLLSEHRSGKHVYYSICDSELARTVARSVAGLARENSPPDGKRDQKSVSKKRAKGRR